ncbi:MAG: ribosome biogenesis GTPase YlqF [Clostridia bacterium]|nr:ribosome biogenesis GTPase YlqF [Clostridia bacterium]
MQIQWFPGHMAKTARLIQDNLKLCDIIIELADARIPAASRNPYLSSLLGNKPRLLILNKADLADPAVNTLWKKQYDSQNITALFVNCRGEKISNLVMDAVRTKLAPLLAKRAAKGMQGAPIRMMVTGIPNVGKSTFINNLAGRAGAKTGDKPGITTGKQWIKLAGGGELLDTPGMLWQKFDDSETGIRLAFTGAVRDTILDMEELAVHLLLFLRSAYPAVLHSRYGIENVTKKEGYPLLCEIAEKRHFLVRGGEPDTERAANVLIDECRGGKLGRFSYERP